MYSWQRLDIELTNEFLSGLRDDCKDVIASVTGHRNKDGAIGGVEVCRVIVAGSGSEFYRYLTMIAKTAKQDVGVIQYSSEGNVGRRAWSRLRF